ncbi:DUF308 domain-containing protein, partial [Ruminococcaceae bacterium OttesenSCG-928-O06]|nr:DUF308 domain-containing protein [Ruminococcaceae bacterium OttesenSCG-928-O06]
MKASKRYILTFSLFSAGYIALGLLLLLAPDQSRQFLSIALGIAAIVAGIARIAWHFAKDDLSRAFHNDIPGGVLLVLAGIYLIARAEVLWDWLPVILGFAVVFDSMVKLQHAFDLKRTGFAHWWAVLALALATAVLGLLLVLGIFGKNILLYY